jgi:endonuclease/exonuclease/phosphatase family metal-dependent hydrolase
MAKKKKIPNDHISELLGGVDQKYVDRDDFLDIVQWNLRWFNSKDKDREDKIKQVLSVLNSDIFVFQEIEDKSLDNIAQALTEEGRGSYKTAYGTTGGQQRIAIMWDMDWVRTKDEIRELFGKNNVTTPSGKDVFPRLPLWSYFFCKSTISNQRGFDFQLVGLHLKSQLDREGTGEDKLQRTLSAAKLSDWLTKAAANLDADSILLGDWNKPPDSEEWDAFRRLEKDAYVRFSEINDPTNFSHLYYRNRNNVGSLLDLRVVTSPFAKEMNKIGGTVHWLALDDLLGSNKTAGEVKKIINEIKNEITDHMPVLTRFGVVSK